MKLKPDLIKAILIWCEKQLPDYSKNWEANELELKGYNQDQIIFHTGLLWENGYIKCINATTHDRHNYIYEHLTMNGYQYLSLLKSKEWNSAKGIMREFGVIFVESAIKAVIDKAIIRGF